MSKVYSGLGEDPNLIEQAAIKAGQFDTAIGQLEERVIGGRHAVRAQLAATLTPNLAGAGATATQEALLTLSKQREGRFRLITTNFDRLFEEVISSKRLSIATYEAPLLPVPKNRWDGLVYLHGLLPSSITPGALDRLVVSSGDFGLAYLTERWAARFVSELFRNFTVCFVGYSINDPVLRYMMDALAADRLLGESSPEMFAFGGSTKGQEEARANEWRAKNVTPILYWEARNHSILHKTLQSWAEVYRDGVLGKERIVMQYAATRPVASTKQDDYVGRMLWALCDKRALPAKRFAEHDPLPSLDWLDPLTELRFKHRDLPRFGVAPDANEDNSLEFSVVRRPSPYARSPLMALVGNGYPSSQWDHVMHELARWLTRHVHDPALILWIVKQGGHVQHEFAWMISRAIVENSPPKVMKTLWGILLSNKIKSAHSKYDLYEWKTRFLRDGMTPVMRMELRDILNPRVSLREPFRMWDEDDGERSTNETRIKEIVNWEIVVGADHVHSALEHVRQTPQWFDSLPDLLLDATTLLRDAMDLMRELGGADDLNDLSYIYQPSISSHAQNRDFHDWTALIELVRDAWLETVKRSPNRARVAVTGWEEIRYPVFRRLALFAAANAHVFAPNDALEVLISDRTWWLWSIETQREALRLLVSLSPRLDPHAFSKLENAILQGPPREMFREDVEPERLQKTCDHMIWLRLAKAQQAGGRLSDRALTRLQAVAVQFPGLQLQADERDEFSSWMDSGNELRTFVVAPKTRRELVEWLQIEVTDQWQEDDWRERCRDHFGAASTALIRLSQDGKWPIDRWRQALQAWAESSLLSRSWRVVAMVLEGAPDQVLQSLAHPLAWWLRSQAKSFVGHDATFLRLVARLVMNSKADKYEPDDDPVNRAINHPIGQSVEAVLHWWYRQILEDDQGLSREIKPLLTDLCDLRVSVFALGRTILAAHLVSLFRVDPDWAKMELIPVFDWARSPEDARCVWEGFLWSPRLYVPLLEALKEPLLDTANHYDQLGKHHGQYAAFLTYAALETESPFSKTELKKATHSLPSAGLEEAAQALIRALDGAGEQRSEYWENRIQPYLKAVWPKSRASVTKSISESFARLAVATNQMFPEAFDALKHWLGPIEHPDYVVNLLSEAEICRKFPDAALEFLALVIESTTQWPPSQLAACLRQIREALPGSATHSRFIRLAEYVRRFAPDDI
ncbi:SIR2 family protein [Massilia sp. TS11]|nr:SIR2 family protein [Massilia sp. TS11]